MSESNFERLHQKCNVLKKIIDPANGLLNELAEEKVFTDRDEMRVKAKATDEDKVEEIVSILRRKPNSALEKFCKALTKSGQEHATHVINKLHDTLEGMPLS